MSLRNRSISVIKRIKNRSFSGHSNGEAAAAAGLPKDGDQSADAYQRPLPSPGTIVHQLLRVDLLAQEMTTALTKGRNFSSPLRPDYKAAYEAEAEALVEVTGLVTKEGVRPSPLGPAAAAAFWMLGAAAELLPRRLSGAMAAGVQDGLTDTLNEQLRELREEDGLAESVPEVRSMIKKLRDRERAPEGAPHAPDITDIRRVSELTSAEGLAAVAKFGTKALLDIARKV